MSTTKTEKAIRIRIRMNPEEDWMTFPLIKIKMTSGKIECRCVYTYITKYCHFVNVGCFVLWIVDKRRDCAIYNLTSQAEDEEEEEQVQPKSKRQRKSKGIPEGFVTNGMIVILNSSVRRVVWQLCMEDGHCFLNLLIVDYICNLRHWYLNFRQMFINIFCRIDRFRRWGHQR